MNNDLMERALRIRNKTVGNEDETDYSDRISSARDLLQSIGDTTVHNRNSHIAELINQRERDAMTARGQAMIDRQKARDTINQAASNTAATYDFAHGQLPSISNAQAFQNAQRQTSLDDTLNQIIGNNVLTDAGRVSKAQEAYSSLLSAPTVSSTPTAREVANAYRQSYANINTPIQKAAQAVEANKTEREQRNLAYNREIGTERRIGQLEREIAKARDSATANADERIPILSEQLMNEPDPQKQAAINHAIKELGTGQTARVKELQAQLNEARRARYATMPFESNFAANSGFDEKNASATDKRINGIKPAEYDPLSDEADKYLDFVTDTERGTYNYLRNTKGQAEADKYLDFLRPELEARRMGDVSKKAQQFGYEHPLIGDIATVLGSPYKNAGTVGAIGTALSGGNVRENAVYNLPSVISSAVRSGANERNQADITAALTPAYKWTLKKFGVDESEAAQRAGKAAENTSKVLTFLKTGTLSHLDSLWNAFIAQNLIGNMGGMGFNNARELLAFNQAAPGLVDPNSVARAQKIVDGAEDLTRIIMGMEAVPDVIRMGKERGLEDDQAFVLGMIAGFAEYSSEKWSLGNLFESDWTKPTIIQVLQQGGFEALEEVQSGIMNEVADLLIAQDKSELKQAVQKYKNNGKDEKTAFALALGERALETGKDALSAFLTTGVSTGITGAYQRSQNPQTIHNKVSSADSKSGGNVGATIDNILGAAINKPDAELAGDLADVVNALKTVYPKGSTINRTVDYIRETARNAPGTTEGLRYQGLADYLEQHKADVSRLADSRSTGENIEVEDRRTAAQSTESTTPSTESTTASSESTTPQIQATNAENQAITAENQVTTQQTAQSVSQTSENAPVAENAVETENNTPAENTAQNAATETRDTRNGQQTFLDRMGLSEESTIEDAARKLFRDVQENHTVDNERTGLVNTIAARQVDALNAMRNSGEYTAEQLQQAINTAKAIDAELRGLARGRVEGGVRALKSMFSRAGLDVDIVIDPAKTTNYETGDMADRAYYDPSDHKVHVSGYMDTDSAMMGVVAHEVFHKAANGTARRQLVSDILEARKAIIDNGGIAQASRARIRDNSVGAFVETYADLLMKNFGLTAEGQAAVQNRMNAQKITQEKAMKFLANSDSTAFWQMFNTGAEGTAQNYIEEEMAAQFIEQLGGQNGESIMRELIRDNRSVLEKIIDAIKRVFNRDPNAQQNATYKRLINAYERIAAEESGQKAKRISGESGEIGVGSFSNDTPADTVMTDDRGKPVQRKSIETMLEPLGLEFLKTTDGRTIFVDSKGNEVSHVTRDMIMKSDYGTLLRASAKNGLITDDDVEAEADFLADTLNLMLDTNDIDLIWAVNSTIGFQPIKPGEKAPKDQVKNKFAALTKNSDKQYGTTIDFTTICLKTQQIIDVMSDMMKREQRGLTEDEIIKIVYKEVADAGEPVPCPVCYVFARWVGLGGLFDNIHKMQIQYRNADEAKIRADIEELRAKIDERTNGSFSKRKTALYKDLVKERNKLDNSRIESLTKQTNDFSAEDQARLDELNQQIQYLDQWTWLNNVRLQKDYKEVPDDILFDINAGKTFAEEYPTAWKFRTTRGPAMGKAASPYVDEHLGQIISGIGSPSNMNRTKRDDKLKQTVENKNYIGNVNTDKFLNTNGNISKSYNNLLLSGMKYAKAQNLLNGERMQSTSDFRYEYALDYLLAFLELQSVGAKVQLYTKVPEMIPLAASVGAEINCSLMPLGDGYVIDENGKPKLVFSSVTGMNAEDAFRYSQMYDNVQPIMVGINRQHILLCMDDDRITFIIPYHASGTGEQRYVAMMGAIEETVTERTDYSDYQNDVELGKKKKKSDTTEAEATEEGEEDEEFYEDEYEESDEEESDENTPAAVLVTAEQKAARNARKKILTGETRKLNEAERDAIRNNDILSQLHIRFTGKDVDGNPAKVDPRYLNRGDIESGIDSDTSYTDQKTGQRVYVKLSSSQAEKIMPFEFWDKTVTIDNADQNAREFIRYCEAMGIKPRFSGYNASTGKYNADYDFTKEKGYWKTIPDRKMFNNDGTYHEQQPINISNLKEDYLTSDRAKTDVYGENDTEGTMAAKSYLVGRVRGENGEWERYSDPAIQQPSKSNNPNLTRQIADRSLAKIKANQRASREVTEQNIREVPSEADRDYPLTDYQNSLVEYNNALTEVGSPLTTIRKSEPDGKKLEANIKRYKNNVGKEMGGQIYVHKNYVNEVVPSEKYEQAVDILNEQFPDFEYNCVMYDPKANVIRFDEAPDFDTAREPIPGKQISVNLNDGTASNVPVHLGQKIWHHKWQWVKNDYEGFDVEESWNWSREYLNRLRPTADKVSNRGVPNGSGTGTAAWNKQLDYFGLPHDPNDTSSRRYSLEVVPEVEPSDDGWGRGLTEAELRDMGYTLFGDVSQEEIAQMTPEERAIYEHGHNTQIKGTVSTYNKIYDKLKREHPDTWQDLRVLDASSGLGYGTKAGQDSGFNVTDIEPYPSKTNYALGEPEYTDYSALVKAVESGEVEPFDVIISNAVLNVLPQDTVDNLTVAMGKLLKPGGEMYINTRDRSFLKDVLVSPKNKLLHYDGDIETVTNKSGKKQAVIPTGLPAYDAYVDQTKTVQRGYTSAELSAYLRDALGDDYSVTPASFIGSAAVKVTKNADAKPATRQSRLVTHEEDAEYMEAVESGDTEKQQQMVDEAARAAGAMTLSNGKLKPYYHGTGEKFTVFDINRAQDGKHGYGFYFSPMKSYAEGYGDVGAYYLMTDRIATREDHNITPEQVVDIREAYNLPVGEDGLEKARDWVAKSNDMDIIKRLESAITRNLDAKPEQFLQKFREVFGYDGLRQANETVLWDNKLMKSADPITYDDDGNVIPPSQRFNPERSDIRESRMLKSDSEYEQALAEEREKRDFLTKQFAGKNSFGYAKALDKPKHDAIVKRYTDLFGEDIPADEINRVIREFERIMERPKRDANDTAEARMEEAWAYLEQQVRGWVERTSYENVLKDAIGDEGTLEGLVALRTALRDPDDPGYYYIKPDMVTAAGSNDAWNETRRQLNGVKLKGFATQAEAEASGRKPIGELWSKLTTDGGAYNGLFTANKNATDYEKLSEIAGMYSLSKETESPYERRALGEYDNTGEVNAIVNDIMYAWENAAEITQMGKAAQAADRRVAQADQRTADARRRGDERVQAEKDKAQARAERVKENTEKREAAMRERFEASYDRLRRSYDRKLDRASERYDKLQNRIKGKDIKRAQRMVLGRIAKDISTIDKLLNRPSKDKNKYIPQRLLGTVVKVRGAVQNFANRSGKTIDPARLAELQQAAMDETQTFMEGLNQGLRSVHTAGDESVRPDANISDAFMTQTDNLIQNLRNIRADIEENYPLPPTVDENGKRITKTSEMIEQENRREEAMYEYFTTVKQLLDMTLKAVRDEGKIILNGRNTDLNAVSEMLAGDLSERRKKDVSLKHRSLKSETGNLFDMGKFGLMSMDPALQMLGDHWYNEIGKSFRDGQNRQMAHQQQFAEFMRKTLGDYDIGKSGFYGDYVELTKPDGTKFNVTRGELMSLYALWNRPAARRHLAKGGGTFVNQNGQAFSDNNVVLDDALVEQYTDKLTDKEKEIVDKVVDFMSHEASKWGNDVSMYVYGYRLFNEDNYFPMETASYANKRNFVDPAMPGSGLNPGFTQALTGSTKPLAIRDFFDVVNNHIIGMSNYNAYGAASHDLDRLVNSKNVNELLQKTYGNGAVAYLKDFIQTTAGTKVQAPDWLKNLRAVGYLAGDLYKRQAVSANLSTVAKQPLSIIRAANVIDPKYLFAKKPLLGGSEYQAVKDKMESLSGVAKIKSLGYSDTGRGKSLQQTYDDSYFSDSNFIRRGLGSNKVARGAFKLSDKLTEAGMWGAGKADEITWVNIFDAVTREVKDKYPNLTSDELDAKITERFNEVIGRTQVVESVLDSAPVIRERAFSLLFPFMNEPVKSASNLILAADRMANKLPGGKKDFAKAVGLHLLSAVIFEPLISTLASMWRDDKDDIGNDFVKHFLEKMFGIAGEDTTATSILTSNAFSGFFDLPFITQIYDTISNALQDYDNTNIDKAWLVDHIKATKNLYTHANDSKANSAKTRARLWGEWIETLAAGLGQPLKTVRREVDGTLRLVMNAINNDDLKWNYAKLSYNLENSNARSQKGFYDILAHAYKTGNVEGYERMLGELGDIVTDTPSLINPKTIAENIEKRGGEIKPGTPLWNIDVQSRFRLETPVKNGQVENLITRTYVTAEKDGISESDCNSLLLTMPKAFGTDEDGDGTEVKMNAVEYDEYTRDVGEYAYRTLSGLAAPANSKAWNRLTIDQQMYAIEKAYAYAKAKYKKDAIPDYNNQNIGKPLMEAYDNNASPSQVASIIMGMAADTKSTKKRTNSK